MTEPSKERDRQETCSCLFHLWHAKGEVCPFDRTFVRTNMRSLSARTLVRVRTFVRDRTPVRGCGRAGYRVLSARVNLKSIPYEARR